MYPKMKWSVVYFCINILPNCSDTTENNSKDAEQQTKDHTQNQTLDKTKTGFGQSETFQMMSDRKMVEVNTTFMGSVFPKLSY